MAYICYSTASCNVLGHADTVDGARAHSVYFSGNDDYAVVFECPLAEAERLESWSSPRHNMPIVWRGSNDMAQNFRKKS